MQILSSDENLQLEGTKFNFLLRLAAKMGGVKLVDRGYFFSRSQALSAERWFQKAKSAAKSGLSALRSGDSQRASYQLVRAIRFFEFAHIYRFSPSMLRELLLRLSILHYRRGNSSSGWKTGVQGILLGPKQPWPEGLSEEERTLLSAVKCNLARKKVGRLYFYSPFKHAAIYVNGYFVGFGPRIVSLRPGTYLLRAEVDGFRFWGKKVKVREGRNSKVRLFFRRSPRADLYEEMCQKLLANDDPEYLIDEMKKNLELFQASQLWIGCIKANSKPPVAHWFSKRSSKNSVEKGRMVIPTSDYSKWTLAVKIVRNFGASSPLPSTLPGYIGFPQLNASSSSCPDPNSILKSSRKKVASVDNSQVGGESSFTIKVRNNNSSGKLLPGQRIIIQTKYFISIEGTVISVEKDSITLQTKYGREKIPRSWIKKIHHRKK